MNETFDLWKLLAGIGIFLFGMYLLEDAVKTLSGKAFRKIISYYTKGRLRAIGSGTMVTAVLQSSSAVSLMVLAFVGAGVMNMENAIGVMIGANIGTTFNAWIVAILGFKLKIETFALPFIAVGGGSLLFFSSTSRWFSISRLLLGFGFLFLGLDYMKVSVESFSQNVDIRQLPDYGLWFYLLLGAGLTAMMQASSATIAIVMTAFHTQLISFDMGAAMIIGANVGTTITVLLGSMGKGVRAKKLVGLSHLVFNMITGLVAFLAIHPAVRLVGMLVNIETNGVTALALFHTIFNIVGAIIFFPFIGLLARTLVKIYPYRKTILTVYLDRTPPEVTDAAGAALGKEICHLLDECQLYNLRSLEIDEKLVFEQRLPFEKNNRKKLALDDLYDKIKLLHAEIFAFYAKLQAHKLEASEVAVLERVIFASRNIMNSIKNFKGIRQDLDEFDSSGNEYLNSQYKSFRTRLLELYLDMNRIRSLEVSDEQHRKLIQAFLHIEEADKRFIRATLGAVAENQIQELEISSLLMVNRLFTQACRLQVFGLKDLLLTEAQIRDFDRAMDTKQMIEEEKAKDARAETAREK